MCNDEVEEQPEPNIVGYAIIILIILAATTKTRTTIKANGSGRGSRIPDQNKKKV